MWWFLIVLLFLVAMLVIGAIERVGSAKHAKEQAKWKADCDRRNWDQRVHNALYSMMSDNPDSWAPSLILESMSQPGHNWRVFRAFGIRYTVEQLGRRGLVQGDGLELEKWIAAHRVECQAALKRYEAKEQAIKDAIDSNAARWEETEALTGPVHKSPARMGLESLKRD